MYIECCEKEYNMVNYSNNGKMLPIHTVNTSSGSSTANDCCLCSGGERVLSFLHTTAGGMMKSVLGSSSTP